MREINWGVDESCGKLGQWKGQVWIADDFVSQILDFVLSRNSKPENSNVEKKEKSEKKFYRPHCCGFWLSQKISRL